MHASDSMTPIRVFIADDHALMREGLKRLFALMTDIAVVGEAGNGDEVLERLAQIEIDLLLLDMTMPGHSGEDLIARIRIHRPALPILILSMHNESQIAQRALLAGASGYITKDSDPAVLLDAIHKVASGKRFIDADIAERMAFSISVGDSISHEALSSRELQVMRMLAQGLSVNEIADLLDISNKTVSTHKARLMEKMRFASNVDIVKYALANGLAR